MKKNSCFFLGFFPTNSNWELCELENEIEMGSFAVWIVIKKTAQRDIFELLITYIYLTPQLHILYSHKQKLEFWHLFIEITSNWQ